MKKPTPTMPLILVELSKGYALSSTEIALAINKTRTCVTAALTKLGKRNLTHISAWGKSGPNNIQHAIYSLGEGLNVPFVRSKILAFNELQLEKKRVEFQSMYDVAKRMDIVAAMFGSGPAPSLSFDFNIYKR